jgi:hypothetical protein
MNLMRDMRYEDKEVPKKGQVSRNCRHSLLDTFGALYPKTVCNLLVTTVGAILAAVCPP